MLSPFEAMHPSHRTIGIILYLAAFVNPLFYFLSIFFEYLSILYIWRMQAVEVLQQLGERNDSNMEGSRFWGLSILSFGTRNEASRLQPEPTQNLRRCKQYRPVLLKWALIWTGEFSK